MPVASKGFRTASIPEELADIIDVFLEENRWGYRSRAEVIVQATREFLQRHGMEPQTTAPQDSSKEASENQGTSETKQKRIHSPR